MRRSVAPEQAAGGGSLVKRLTAWKLTSPWLRVPEGARRVRMIFSGRWKLQSKDEPDVRVYGDRIAADDGPEEGERDG